MTKNLGISASLEDYLESILIIKNEKNVVRVKDLAKRMQVKAPSVVESLKKLKERKLIVQEHYGYIELTQEGINIAKEIYEKHIILMKFFHNILGVDEKIAQKDACEIEHYLSKETLDKIIKFINFIDTCPLGASEWLKNFYYFAEHGKRSDVCAGMLSRRSSKNSCKLVDLEIGKKAKIVKILDTSIIKSRLLNMGFVKDEIIEVVKVSPLGSPIDVLIKNTHISLRKEEAEKIMVEVL